VRALDALVRNVADPLSAGDPLLTSPAGIAGEGQAKLRARLSLTGRGAWLASFGAAPEGAVWTQRGTVSSSSTAILGCRTMSPASKGGTTS
jgi:hypothetical protein